MSYKIQTFWMLVLLHLVAEALAVYMLFTFDVSASIFQKDTASTFFYLGDLAFILVLNPVFLVLGLNRVNGDC
ncbi:MAG: hypothetical protein HWN68_08295 [Desulfobacterales bacterium]|nr:hypothetical protein [Desulfobacterales bacterium]